MVSSYVGRFAPSPSGPLHMGSLVCALASYLDAKQNDGAWLIRIEDIDAERCKDEHVSDILDTLASYQLLPDQPVVKQSDRQGAYNDCFGQLLQTNAIFPCNCTRQQLQKKGHQFICEADLHTPHSWRLTLSDNTVHFNDLIQNSVSLNPLTEFGHPIIKRKDNGFSYLASVVIDDYLQGITHVIRGMDLLSSTATQIQLFSQFGWNIPLYGHIPLVMENSVKLSKQNHAPAIPKGNVDTLKQALAHLKIPSEEQTNIPLILQQAIRDWDRKHCFIPN
ncbi:tRNA glutamyl-Q(34) synthetase GluQRS [Marinomonas agarivorans]|nr:tRNA glutamyl-Q(34) synthetase GluQRS [Marinomonas agarivorans]